MTKHFFDALPIELLFLLTVVFMLLLLEAGYRFGLRAHSTSAKAQTAQVRELLMEYIDGRLEASTEKQIDARS